MKPYYKKVILEKLGILIDAKGVFRNRKSMAKRKIDQRQTKVHRTHYRKVKIEQLDPTQNLG
jgi:hypothetical protein